MKCGESIYNIFITSVEKTINSANSDCKLEDVAGSAAFLAGNSGNPSKNFPAFDFIAMLLFIFISFWIKK